MTRFFGIFSALLITITIGACSSSSTGPDGFEPQRYGNFITTSETTAQWVGGSGIQTLKGASTSAIQTDTVFYGKPNHNSLKIASLQTSDTLFVNAVYTDSTMTRAWYDSTNAKQSLSWGNAFNRPLTASYDNNATSIETGIPFSCDSTFTLPGDLIKIFIPADEGGIYQVVNIDARGFYEATDALVCR